MLERLLRELERQQVGGGITFSIVVADNDAQQSARASVTAFARASRIETIYCCEPRNNIAMARNKTLEHAKGDYIAFIDDDEFPSTSWLSLLVKTCEEHDAAGVLGPVRPYFDEPPPRWVIEGRFCERPEHPTGRVMHWEESRTGNLLFRRRLLDGLSQPFDPTFGSGGEDMDFFRRMAEAGCVFVWCNEAVAFESVPPVRLKRSYMLRRALLRGKNILKHSSGAGRFVAVSLIATPLYAAILPITLFFGHHHFMKYSIKFCDHAGRLLALVGMNPIDKRP
jgi:glycosyltransferase involved in cell wall biosynthesis